MASLLLLTWYLLVMDSLLLAVEKAQFGRPNVPVVAHLTRVIVLYVTAYT